MYEAIGNKLTYMGNSADGYSIYEMQISGRPIFEAKASQTEKNNPIYIRPSGGLPNFNWIQTNLRAFVADEGNGFEHITSDSMKDSIYGNLVFLLADLLVGPVQK